MAGQPIKVLFMGTPEFAVPALQALLAAPHLFCVVGVVTQPDRPAGRGRKLAASAVKQCALSHNLAVLTPKRMRTEETRAALQAFGADVFVVAAYGRILPPQLLKIPAAGCINVHASLLPRFRGASPIARAIWAGDERAGVCIMGMEEGLDTGPVYAQDSVAIGPDETCGTLTQRLAALGATLLAQALPAIVAGTLQPTPQPNIGVTHAPPLQKEDGVLDFCGEAQGLARQVRALCPWPGTHAYLGDQRVGIVAARACEGPGPQGSPGEVVAAGAKGLVVACGTGFLAIDQVKPAGRGQMPAAAWISGRGPKKGAILKSHPDSGG